MDNKNTVLCTFKQEISNPGTFNVGYINQCGSLSSVSNEPITILSYSNSIPIPIGKAMKYDICDQQ